MKHALGRHLLVEFYNCNPDIINDVNRVEAHMNRAAEECGATIVQSVFHRFEPYGVSGVVVIAESHLAIHTWPEYRYASVDLYTCGGGIDPMVAYAVLKKTFSARTAEIQTFHRGNLEAILRRLPLDSLPTKGRMKAELAQKGGVAS